MKTFTKIMLGANAVIASLTVVKAIRTANAVKKAEVLVIGGHTVKVDKYGFMKSAHAAVAMVAEMKDTGKYQIFVDESFLSLDKDVQLAILAHEDGHIKLGHLENVGALNAYKRAIESLKGAQKIELEADAYAATVVGVDSMIKALEALMALDIPLNKREIDYRIKTLKGEV